MVGECTVEDVSERVPRPWQICAVRALKIVVRIPDQRTGAVARSKRLIVRRAATQTRAENGESTGQVTRAHSSIEKRSRGSNRKKQSSTDGSTDSNNDHEDNEEVFFKTMKR